MKQTFSVNHKRSLGLTLSLVSILPRIFGEGHTQLITMKTNTPLPKPATPMPAKEFPLTSFGVDYHNKLLTLYTSWSINY